MTTPIVIETTTREPADWDDFLGTAAPQPSEPDAAPVAPAVARRLALAE
ncbi:hypothetical protein [Conexibacter sp. SYSU D00693]|nr:hypothetical protein [Conexibacter sp. SYSU D00693]